MPLALSGTTGINAGTGPVFSAYATVAQSLTSASYVKLLFPTEEATVGDSHGYYDAANSRFQPLIPGWYTFTGGFQIAATTTTLVLQLYKNGSSVKTMGYVGSAAGGVWGTATIYLNGTTDYVELYGQQSAATQNTLPGASFTWFAGYLARSA